MTTADGLRLEDDEASSWLSAWGDEARARRFEADWKRRLATAFAR